MKKSKIVLYLPCSLMILFFVVIAEAGSLPDFLKAEIGVQLKEDGRLTGEIHHLRLGCFEGKCQINTLVLNRCTKQEDWNVQFPFAFTEESSDRGATFRVKGNVMDVSVIGNSFGGKTMTTYRFELSQMSDISKVLKFSGGYMKDSALTKSLIKVEFIPLHGEYNRVDLACPIELPGIAGRGN